MTLMEWVSEQDDGKRDRNSRASAVVAFDAEGVPRRVHAGFWQGYYQQVGAQETPINGTIMPDGAWRRKK